MFAIQTYSVLVLGWFLFCSLRSSFALSNRISQLKARSSTHRISSLCHSQNRGASFRFSQNFHTIAGSQCSPNTMAASRYTFSSAHKIPLLLAQNILLPFNLPATYVDCLFNLLTIYTMHIIVPPRTKWWIR